jgi:hypothetical protein
MRTIIFGLLFIAAGSASIANAGRPGGGADTPSYPGTNLGTLR